MANLTPGDPQEFLPLTRVKQELRLDPADTDQDELLRGHIASAASFVGHQIGSPILDETVTRYVTLAGQQAVCFREPFWRSTDRISYAGGAVDLAAITQRREGVSSIIWPPEGGWPPLDPNGADAFRFDFTIGLDMARSEAAGLRQAAILCVRQLYDGVAQIRAEDAVYALLRPYMAAVVLPRVTTL